MSARNPASGTNSTDAKIQTVDCPAGTRLLGGGARILPETTGNSSPYADVIIGSSYPLDNNTWRAQAEENDDTSTSWALEIFAICASVNP